MWEQWFGNLEFDDPVTGRQWWVQVVFRLVNGRAEVVEMNIADRDGRGLTAQAMREVPWGGIIADLRADFAAEHRRQAAEHVDNRRRGEIESEWAEQISGRAGQQIARADLPRVAEIYRAAARGGTTPTQEVADAFNCGRSTAARWIKRARVAGLLGPALPGRGGEAQEGV